MGKSDTNGSIRRCSDLFVRSYAITLFTQKRDDLEQQRASLQKELAASQAQNELAKVKAQTDASAMEAARTRLNNHSAAIKDAIDKFDNKYWTVRFLNATGAYISVAVSSTALDGAAQTTGWAILQQGESMDVIFTRTRPFWYAVVPANPNCRWQPANVVSVSLPISRDGWTQLTGDLFVARADGYQYFYPDHVSIPQWGTQNFTIGCS